MKDQSEEQAHYNDLVARQIDQYKETEVMHDLPPIYHYRADKHLNKRSGLVTGCTDEAGFYAHYFRSSLQASDSIFLVSIGAGDCSLEIEIAKRLIGTGEKFLFICLEISPILIEKARARITAASLNDFVRVDETDINTWNPENPFAGIMAHHSLHHFINLEALFGLIKNNLAKQGRFVTCDIIGRNGHMRWPEALSLTRGIWDRLPRKYKYNHQFGRYEDYFSNFDCATDGFEGIRAEDILPLLVKSFSFEVFLGYNNLIDPFIDRSFGPNFDPHNPLDTAFIDYLEDLNDKLISKGILKPTSMTAVMLNEPVGKTKIYSHWDPVFSIRDPRAAPPVFDLQPLLKNMPLKASPGDDPLFIRQAGYYELGCKLIFGESKALFGEGAADGLKYIGYGWGYPEQSFIWSENEDASILFPLKEAVHGPLLLNLSFIPYKSSLYPRTVIEVIVNGVKITHLQYDTNSEAGQPLEVNLEIPESVFADKKTLEITFQFPTRRLPQSESGGDLRSLGIALQSATLSAHGWQEKDPNGWYDRLKRYFSASK